MKILLGCFMLLSVSCFSQEEVGSEGAKKSRFQKNRERAIKKVERKRAKEATSDIISQPLRLEIPIQDRNDEFVLVEGADENLLLIQNTHKVVPDGILWKFRLVNKELAIEWELAQVVPNQGELIGYDYSAGYYFLLFNEANKYREYKIMMVDVRGEELVFQEVSLPFEINLHFFEALDKGILLVGEYNYRPVALLHDIVSGKPKILPGFYNHNERVFDLVIDEEGRTFSIVLSERMRNNKYTNRIKSFTFDGLLIQENVINPGEKFNLVDGTTTNFGNGLQYMVGTYSIKSSLFSHGIYISKFSNGHQRFIKNYNYGDLKNFFNYKGERAVLRIQRKVERKKEKGKEPRFNYRLYIHEIIENGDLKIVIAEAYYPKYSSSTSYDFSGGNLSYSHRSTFGLSSQRTFLGYKYTHAIILAFNSNGEMVWDNSFKTNDITSYNLEKSVALNVQGDRAVIMYLDENQIKSKVVQGGHVVEGKTFNPVKLMNLDDILESKYTEVQGIKSWYDNNLYSFGTQKIRNKNFKKGRRIRKVFYINKIQFDPAS